MAGRTRETNGATIIYPTPYAPGIVGLRSADAAPSCVNMQRRASYTIDVSSVEGSANLARPLQTRLPV
jgi:hypothetical protein